MSSAISRQQPGWPTSGKHKVTPEKNSKRDAMAILTRSWEKLSLNAMESAWKISRPDEEEESGECAAPEEEEEEKPEDTLPDELYSGTDNSE
jgi:hypothetical protein